jgi:hypothetical protein
VLSRVWSPWVIFRSARAVAFRVERKKRGFETKRAAEIFANKVEVDKTTGD